MGYKKPVGTETVTLPSDPQWWVKLRDRAGFGATSKAENAMAAAIKIKRPEKANGAKPDEPVDLFDEDGLPNFERLDNVQYDAYVKTLMVEMIVEWNLTDERDRPLPITLASIDDLDELDGDFLAREIQKRIRRRPAKERIPFEKPSGPLSTDIKSPTQTSIAP